MWTYYIWGAVLVLIILMLVRLRARFSVYICPQCKHEYTLSPVQEFFFPQVMYKKLSRCPDCRRFVAAAIIRNPETTAEAERLQHAKTKAKSPGSHSNKSSKNKGNKNKNP